MENSGYVVAVGASAGGLEAINQLFDNMPENTGAVFVVIQHLSPDYKSLMAELLGKHTSMQVYEVHTGIELKADCIYLIPPKKIMTIKGNQLRLHEKDEKAIANFAIDTFFESLAAERGKCGIGVILSGTGTDGTRGIEALRAAGGFVLVQEPLSALFDGMPNSAIGSGQADVILPPDMMGDEIFSHVKDSNQNTLFTTQADENTLQDILGLIKRTTTHDFFNYKRATLYRRIAKRMMELGHKSLKDYYNRLLDEAEEVKRLLTELLINVTRFFRDEEAFDVIQNQVIPALFAAKKAGDTIKLWVVACSSGEEVYSLAILFEEYMNRHRIHNINVKIFATDIDTDALDMASKGYYTAEQLKHVGKERIQRFFDKDNDGYKVIALLRKKVVIAKHDVISDPPFSRLDFISCRNMLIYMNPMLQKSILRTFHFAVTEGGYIFLGPSENIDLLKDSVKEVDRKWKIFKVVKKLNLQDRQFLLSPMDKQSFYKSFPDAKPKSKNALLSLPEVFKDTLLEAHPYAGVYIDRENDVKQAIGNFKDFLNFPEGQFNFNLLKMVPQELSIALGAAIRKAIQTDEKVMVNKIKVHDGDKTRHINVIVKPYLQQTDYLQPFLFVILNEEAPAEKKARHTETVIIDATDENRTKELEKELKETRENLQAVIEELESANEELQSHSEEILTSNEELQSTNEELQSLNEELHTVSAEHQMKIKELLELNDDLNNYFRTSNVGQILIDRKLIIRRFSPGITEQINIIETDLGRSIIDFTTRFSGIDFVNDVKEVIKKGKPVEKEVGIDNDKIFMMRIHPYVRLDKSVDGVVVTFFDITEIKRLNSIIEGVFNSSLSGITALKSVRNNKHEITDFEWITSNTMADKLLGLAPGSLIGKRMKEMFPDTTDESINMYAKVVETGEPLHFEYLFGEKWMELVLVKMLDGLVVTFTDVTDKKHASDLITKNYEELKSTSGKLVESNEKLEQSNFDLMQFASVASHDLKEPLRKIQVFSNQLNNKIMDKLEDDEKEYLSRIISAAGRMQKLIEDILTVSKLSNTDAPFTPTNLNEILTRLQDDLEITIKEKNAKIEVDELPKIDSLPGQMHQLFQNLIVNALKFNDSEQPFVQIRNTPLSKEEVKQLQLNTNRNYTRITVEDNGLGFEEKYKDKIFGVFQRLHGAQYPGTGIGLAISKKIVDNHEGIITAESEPDKGSKFTIIFPVSGKKGVAV